MAQQQHEIKQNEEIKIIFLGETRTGKTDLLNQWLGKGHNNSYSATIDVDRIEKRIEDKGLLLHNWDTSGLYRDTAYGHIPDNDIIVLVFDVTKQDSFNQLDTWFEMAKKHKPNAPIIVIGNKIDLDDKRAVSYENAKVYADRKDARYIETSAKTGKGLDQLEKNIVEIHNEMPKNKTEYIEPHSVLLEKIIKFQEAWKEDLSIFSIVEILKSGLVADNKQDYFEKELPALREHLNALRFRCSSVFNTALNLVMTVLSIVGFPVAYFSGWLSANQKNNGDMFTFFAFGEYQKARAMCREVLAEQASGVYI